MILDAPVIDSITYEGAQVTWSGDTSLGNEFKEYIILLTGPTSTATYSSPSNEASNVYTFFGLEPDTDYSIEIKVNTVTYGESEYNDEISFTTISQTYDDLAAIDQLRWTYVRFKTQNNYSVTLLPVEFQWHIFS